MLRWLIAQTKGRIWVHKLDLNGFQTFISSILVKATEYLWLFRAVWGRNDPYGSIFTSVQGTIGSPHCIYFSTEPVRWPFPWHHEELSVKPLCPLFSTLFHFPLLLFLIQSSSRTLKWILGCNSFESFHDTAFLGVRQNWLWEASNWRYITHVNGPVSKLQINICMQSCWVYYCNNVQDSK